MGIGNNIKKVRTDNNLTQEEFAKRLGVTFSAISQWETNRAAPRMGMVQKN